MSADRIRLSAIFLIASAHSLIVSPISRTCQRIPTSRTSSTSWTYRISPTSGSPALPLMREMEDAPLMSEMEGTFPLAFSSAFH
ncbi:hypothetical protein HMPREF9332_01515 [Alloprevotella rava F0323]|uniref:Uncharacterized protein n=1 Tax=Alloprevotella rava F0323 TaxID=679199 RepID=G5GD86_9BACT|nr:hypothetical protein HMPREF9332_01515 [Alloprevotella rava F0323]